MTDAELNEAVAKKLGWTQKAPPRQHLWRRPGEGYDRLLWGFCEKIDPAWEIVTKHLPEGFELIHPQRGYGDPVKWIAQFTEEHSVCDCDDGHDTEVNIYRGEADTAPRAICEAFLKLP